MPHLLDLPNEVIVSIIAACAEDRDHRHRLGPESLGRQTILSFAKSCRHAFSLAEPWLYNALTLRKSLPKSESFKDFKRRLLEDPRRDAYIKDIALVPISGDVDPDLLGWATFLATLDQIEHVHIQVPFSQPDATDDEETGDYSSPFWTNFRKTFANMRIPQTRIPAWASSLRTCHLNFCAPNGYSVRLGDIAYVVAAPNIREVSFVAADLTDFELDRKSIRPRTSPLQRLYLENCIVSDAALRHIISIPRGLVSFCEYGGILPNESTTHHDRLYTLIQALTQHRSTLTNLSVNPRDLRTLTDFETSTSRTITFAPLSSLSNLTIDFRDWRFEPGPTTFLECLPYRLKHLRLKVDLSQYVSHGSRDFDYWANYFSYWANRIRRRTSRYRSPTSTFPRLKSFAAELMHITPRVISASQRDTLETAAWRLKKESKVRLLLYRRTKQRNAIPPYLWDEYEPELVTMLDSDLMEKQKLWDDQTTSEIEEANRAEKQWELNRMIELDQLRLEMRRQQLVKQVEKWEQDEMPSHEDLDAASAAWKKEKERRMREALNESDGLPLVPPENATGWDWEASQSSSTDKSTAPGEGESTGDTGPVPSLQNTADIEAAAALQLTEELMLSSFVFPAVVLPPLPTTYPESGDSAQPSPTHGIGATSPLPDQQEPSATIGAHKSSTQEALPSLTSTPTAPPPSVPSGSTEASGTAEPSGPIVQLEQAPATVVTAPEIEGDQKQRESKDKDKDGLGATKPAAGNSNSPGNANDNDAASDEDQDVESVDTGPSGPGSSHHNTAILAVGPAAGVAIKSNAQPVAVG